MNSEYHDMKHRIWRQMPPGSTQCSWSPCFNFCGNIARGGGDCIDCLQVKLAVMVGDSMAKAYIEAVRRVRVLEIDMEGLSGKP